MSYLDVFNLCLSMSRAHVYVYVYAWSNLAL